MSPTIRDSTRRRHGQNRAPSGQSSRKLAASPLEQARKLWKTTGSRRGNIEALAGSSGRLLITYLHPQEFYTGRLNIELPDIFMVSMLPTVPTGPTTKTVSKF
jgi:hypothetical protein